MLLGCARAPADPDLKLTCVGLGGERDVDDHRAQQPLAIALGGRLGGPQLREVADERLKLLTRGLGPRLVLLGELGLGFGELMQLLLPAGLEASGDQAVVGLAGVERALGADRLIAGALDVQLDRAGRARAAVGDLIGGSERQLDLPRLECREQLGSRPARRRPSS